MVFAGLGLRPSQGWPVSPNSRRDAQLFVQCKFVSKRHRVSLVAPGAAHGRRRCAASWPVFERVSVCVCMLRGRGSARLGQTLHCQSHAPLPVLLQACCAVGQVKDRTRVGVGAVVGAACPWERKCKARHDCQSHAPLPVLPCW